MMASSTSSRLSTDRSSSGKLFLKLGEIHEIVDQRLHARRRSPDALCGLSQSEHALVLAKAPPSGHQVVTAPAQIHLRFKRDRSYVGGPSFGVGREKGSSELGRG
jgi:hypothetical protein